MNYPEKFLEFVYSRKLFVNPLYSDCGEQIYFRIIGKLNKFEGPDYLNAQVIIKGKPVKTDIELDIDKTSWINHGHYKNPNYSATYIQIYFEDDYHRKNVKLQKTLYRINLREQLIYSIDVLYNDWLEICNPNKVYSCNLNKLRNKQKNYEYIYSIGIKTFNTKVTRSIKLIQKYGAVKAFSILIARGLGYGANKNMFTRLAINIDFEKLTEKYSLLRRNNLKLALIEEIKKLSIQISIENTAFMRAWKNLQSRPQNNYNYRFENFARLLVNILFLENNDLISLINCNCVSVKSCINFINSLLVDDSAVIGRDHIKIITANALLPFAYALHSENRDDYKAANIMNLLYKFNGCLMNSKLEKINSFLNAPQIILKKSFVFQLGLLNIYDNYCINFNNEINK